MDNSLVPWKKNVLAITSFISLIVFIGSLIYGFYINLYLSMLGIIISVVAYFAAGFIIGFILGLTGRYESVRQMDSVKKESFFNEKTPVYLIIGISQVVIFQLFFGMVSSVSMGIWYGLLFMSPLYKHYVSKEKN